MEAVLNTRWKDFWLVGTLSLETAQGERTELDWIWKRDAVRITSACRETHSTAEASRRTEVERRKGAARDAELDKLRKLFAEALRGRWADYSAAMSAWATAMKPPDPSDDDNTARWLQAHADLPLPLGRDPSPAALPMGPGAAPERPELWSDRVACWEKGLRSSHQSFLQGQPLLVQVADGTMEEYPETKRLRSRMDAFLRTALPRYDQAMLAWKAAFGPVIAHGDATSRPSS
jgi:hypothetical protein